MSPIKFRHKTLIVVSSLAAGVLLLTYLSFRQDMDAAHDRIARGSRVVETPCGLIEYALAGTGPPLLMIHGAGGGFDQGMDFGRPLTERGFKVIAMSRFGYLRTPLPVDASPMAQADAHACLLDALELKKVFVVGASMGAPSTLQLCIRHADRCTAMVLLVPMTFSPRQETEPPQQPSAFVQWFANAALKSDFVFWVGTKIARETLIETLLATPYAELESANSAEQDRVFEILHHILPIGQRAEGLRNDASTELPRYELEKISIPTLVTSTETDLFDTFKNARYTADQIPGARFLGYSTGGHIWVGHDAEILSEIATFLNRQ